MPFDSRSRSYSKFLDAVDRMEGDAKPLDEDPNLSSKQKKAANAKLEIDLTSDVTTDEKTSDIGDDEVTQRVRRPDPSGRVAWSEDEDSDAAYKKFLRRRKKRAKRTSTRQKPATARSKRKKSSGVVGLQEGRRNERPEKQPTFKQNGQLLSDSDEDKIEAELPEYIKKRRAELEENKKQLHIAGLRLPPAYDDVYFSDDERLESLLEKPDMGELEPRRAYEDVPLPSAAIIPASISQWLRDYQVEGAAKLHDWFVEQKGGILGDDMGLGKTIQVIAFLTAAFGKTGDERDSKRMRKMRRSRDNTWYPKVLIVCPGTLMSNWQSELAKWGWWHVDAYHGSVTEKERVIETAQAGRLEIMITTYTTYRINRSTVNLVDWDCVIADECHTIKERSAEITQAMNEVNSLCRIGLTGTAIQNKYDELWTLLNWTNPGRFGPRSSWQQVISVPLKHGQSHDATVPELARARSTARKLVNNLLPDFFLRRMKTLIADQLPKKSDRVVFCPLTTLQAEAYENFVSSLPVQYVQHASEPCPCGKESKRGWCCFSKIPADPPPDLIYENLTHEEAFEYSQLEDSKRWQTVVFPAITTLQKLSNHLGLLIPSSTDDTPTQIKTLEKLQLALPDIWQDLYSTRDSITNYANQDFCGKWRILKRLLSFWHGQGDCKVLVFSHSVKLLKMLQTLFTATTSYTVSYFDGSMSYTDRSAVVDEFNNSPNHFVFLISTRAGGVGLNITSANKVVIVDPNWNPSHDLQAQDRAYRIGQARDVDVFRLVSAGTIEEIVYARQIYKQQQANIGYNASTERRYFSGVQDAKEKKGEIFGLNNLFSFRGENVVLREIVNKTNIAESKAGVNVAGLDFDSVPPDQDGEDDEEIFDPTKLANPQTNSRKRAKPSPSDRFSSNLHDNDPDLSDPVLSQLAQLISQGSSSEDPPSQNKKQKLSHDPVQAILASAGVSYSHDNAQVIGSSRVESRLSRHAEQTGFRNAIPPVSHDMGMSEKVFPAGSRPGSSSGATFVDGRWRKDRLHYRFNPPDDVRKRQFVTMATEFLGYNGTVGGDEVDGITRFALLVESWNQKQRRACLEKFYRWRAERANDDSADGDDDVDADGKKQGEVKEEVRVVTTSKAADGQGKPWSSADEDTPIQYTVEAPRHLQNSHANKDTTHGNAPALDAGNESETEDDDEL